MTLGDIRTLWTESRRCPQPQKESRKKNNTSVEHCRSVDSWVFRKSKRTQKLNDKEPETKGRDIQ